MIENDKQLEELFSKLFSSEIPMSYSKVDEIGEYLAKNTAKVNNEYLMKFVRIMYQTLKNDITSRQ